ncbi:MAG: hypothetical protein ABIR83_15445 [Nakamurella sp.]
MENDRDRSEFPEQSATSTTASTDTATTNEPSAETTTPATEPTTSPAPAQPAAMPYPLPATHGTTGAEEPIDTAGRVRSTGGAVTWSQHAALGRPYRDFYITMRWDYAAWNFDGTATDIDQAQYQWFAQRPRLVLVTNPRTGDSIIAAAIEAGPGPWVDVTGSANRAKSQGPRFGWTNPTPDHLRTTDPDRRTTHDHHRALHHPADADADVIDDSAHHRHR